MTLFRKGYDGVCPTGGGTCHASKVVVAVVELFTKVVQVGRQVGTIRRSMHK